jgi:hypothetical protein
LQSTGRNASSTRRSYGSGNRNLSNNSKGPNPYTRPGARDASKNSSNGGSGARKYILPGYGANGRPVPNYMRGKNDASSKERSGSYNRKVPADYKPPHLRNNYTGGNRVSPGTRVSPGGNRQSSNSRLYDMKKKASESPAARPYGANKKAPSPNRSYGISNLGGPHNMQRKAPGL